jgi:uncharacterized membrane protein
MTAKVKGLAAGRALAALAAAGLAATSAAAMSLDLSGTIQAKGAKPAWTLEISDTRFTLSRPGKPAVEAVAPGSMITPQGASWSAKTADGRPMQVSLQDRACTLAGRSYPMTAQVTFSGETLSGCAAKAG